MGGLRDFTHTMRLLSLAGTACFAFWNGLSMSESWLIFCECISSGLKDFSELTLIIVKGFEKWKVQDTDTKWGTKKIDFERRQFVAYGMVSFSTGGNQKFYRIYKETTGVWMIVRFFVEKSGECMKWLCELLVKIGEVRCECCWVTEMPREYINDRVWVNRRFMNGRVVW